MIEGQVLLPPDNNVVTGPLMRSSESLSFWGGIDPTTGTVIDHSHPLVGQCVTDTILCLPSGRGSCTASQVLLELILNGIAPKAILLRDRDGLVAVGALIAEEVFGVSLPILCVKEEGFAELLTTNEAYAAVTAAGCVYLGKDESGLDGNVRVDATLDEVKTLRFSDKEEMLLAASSSEAERTALRVIFRYARIMMDEPTYTPVSKAHIDGCTYIGPGGLAFVQRLVKQGGRVVVPTTLNSISTDRRRWKALGVPEEYARNAIALGDAYLELGCLPSFTCAPYLLSHPPKQGENLVWGESNAVVYANSVLGSRTEKYADYLDICGAIAGIVPRIGAHVPANRVPQVVLDATDLELSPTDDTLDLDALFPVLGHLCGTLADGRVPILIGLEDWASTVTSDHLKAFCAAYGTTGTSPLIHIAGITPEAVDINVVKEWVHGITNNRARVSLQGLEETYQLLDKDQQDSTKIDLIALGNPHLSTTECEQLANLVKDGKRKHDNVRIIGCISREVYDKSKPFVRQLEEFGMTFINDTCWCMLLDPPVIPTDPNGVTLTNSGKYAHYGPGLTNRRFRFAGTRDCITAATTGKLPTRGGSPGSRPAWLLLPNIQQRRLFCFTRSLKCLFRF